MANLHTTVSSATMAQIRELAEDDRHGTMRSVIEKSVDRIYREETTMDESGEFTIDDEKLEGVIEQCRALSPLVTDEMVKDHVLYDWPQGDEHQAWLDSATVDEIIDWVCAGLDIH